ncbi:MAG: hypothetical protein Q9185_001871 [Variospora sp. 1 TL-2023]
MLLTLEKERLLPKHPFEGEGNDAPPEGSSAIKNDHYNPIRSAISRVQELSNRVGTHYVIAEVEVDTTQAPTAENTEKLREAFKAKVAEEAAKEVAKEKESKKGGKGEKGGKDGK